jgi:hypothetical protein
MSSKQVAVIMCDNFSRYTWDWLMADAPHEITIENSYGVVKCTFIESDQVVVVNWRAAQESITLTLPNLTEFAQSILGTSAGLGVHCSVSCRFTKKQHLEVAEGNHVVNGTDIINVVPFEDTPNEMVQRCFCLNIFLALTS